MTLALLLGGGLAMGLLLLYTGLFPARIPLATALERVHHAREHRRPSTGSASPWTHYVGAPLASTSFGANLQRRFATDLRVADRRLEDLLGRMVLAFVVGLLWAPVVAALMAAGGVTVSWVVPAWGSVSLGVVGALVPVLAMRSEAGRRRLSFRHALSCFLDLVAVRLAGGAGVDGALGHSAQTGQGWAFAGIRQALAEARLMGEPPWTGLARLGEELGIPELGELAASTALAGGEGARVRSSLGAKARAIRTRGLAEAEAAAQSASERMSLPVVLLMLGFVAFLGYPAVMQVFTGL